MTHRSASLCLAAALLFATGEARAQTPGRPAPIAMQNGDELITRQPGARHVFSLSEADVGAVLADLEYYTGRTVLRTEALPTTSYSITIDQPLPKSELVLALETLLELNNVGVTPLGDRFLKVVPLQTIKSEAPEIITGSTLGLPPSGRVATKFFQLQFLRVGEFFNQGLGGIFSPNIGGFGASVVVLEKANAAIVTDTIANLQRVETLLAEMDRPSMGGLKPKFYTLHNGAKASDVVTKLKTMLTGPIANQIGSATTFTADDRTNQIALLADDRQIPLFDELIGKLDISADPNIHNEVIRLKTADAAILVQQVLGLIVTGQTTSLQRAGATGQSINGAASGGGNGFGGNGFGGNGFGNAARPAGPTLLANGTPAPATGFPGAQTAAPVTSTSFANTPSLASVLGSAAQSAEFSSIVQVVPDERTNSVVVSGTLDDIRLLKELIAKLDVALPQVSIEVLIVEVTLDDKDISGLSALGLTVGTDNTRGTHITNFTGSVAGWDVTSGVVNPLALQAALNSASTGNRTLARVLQATTIMTTHNKQGEITVGDEEPIVTGGTTTALAGSSTSTANSTNFTTSEVPIELDLKVTPLIGDDGSIQLNVDQKVDNHSGDVTINGNDTPIIDHREVISYMTVKDGEMIVLGGLQKTAKTQTHNKLGLLYEIPIISQLLGGHTDELQRDELLLFLRPHVVTMGDTTSDTQQAINRLSNKDDVEQYLKKPGPLPDSKVKNMLDRFKGDN